MLKQMESIKAWISGHRIAVIVTGSLLVAAFFVTASPVFEECVKANQPQNQNAGFYEPIANFIGRLWWCGGVFSEENGGAITAFASIAIGIFTLTLWLSSREQGRLTQQTIELARDEFNATHRPRVRIRAVEFAESTDKQPFKIAFSCMNIGDARCAIEQLRYEAHEVKGPVPKHAKFVSIDPENVILNAGEAHVYVTEDITIPDEEWSFEFFGYVAYRDIAGVRRITGFWRRYDGVEELWRHPGHPDYEFEY